MQFARAIIPTVEKNFYALVVDDEPQVRSFVAEVLRTYGWNVSEAETAGKAFEILNRHKWLLVFCAVTFKDADGYTILRRFAAEQTQARFVFMTGERESKNGSFEMTADGAYDYLFKPFTVDDILSIAKVVYEQHQLDSKVGESKSESESADYTSELNLIGKSPKFVESLKMVGRIAPTNLPVIITGESGTGKEVIARAIHKRSNRASGAFVAVNCGAIPTELIDSELFGHARGAFTGADSERAGLWEEADGGTLFLDEITETNPLFQVKLLRALQQKEIRRVGSNKSKKVDVRVIAATNCDIEEEVREGRFRGDLMYRLNTVIIQLPALKERVEDIPLLARYFAERVDLPDARHIEFSTDAIEMLKNYHWRGNVRELENAVVHAVSLCDSVIYPEHLPLRIQNFTEETKFSKANDSKPNESETQWLPLGEMKAKYVAKVLSHTNGNKRKAIDILNIDRKTLVNFIKRNQSNSR